MAAAAGCHVVVRRWFDCFPRGLGEAPHISEHGVIPVQWGAFVTVENFVIVG
jgi:hypothetical protein